MNVNAIKLLRPTFDTTRLADITPEAVESYLKHRLKSGKRIRTGFGFKLRGKLKPMTVHQEFRVLRRMRNVAVRQRRLASNPCSAAEFPIPINHTIRKPHYMTSTEQQKIEFCAPSHLKYIVVIISEMGLRPYKELMPMKKPDVDLENSVVHIPDSKTPSGIGDMPMTPLAHEAFRAQIAATPGTSYLFPCPKRRSKKPYIQSLKQTWAGTLKRAKVHYFPLYHLRHTFATRLSAGGVSDHFVTLMLRQGDAQVFKRYSQATLNMKREALTRLDRSANEHAAGFATAKPN